MDVKLNGMDRISHLAQLGMWGDEDAIKKLLLQNVEIAKLPALKDIERSSLATCLNVGGKALAAGVKMGLNCLEHSGRNLMTLAQFLAKDQLKITLKPDIDKDDVLVKMKQICKDTINWCKKIGEPNDGKFVKNMEWYAEKLVDARSGDFQTLRQLDFQKMPSLKIKPLERVPSHMSLQLDYSRASEIATTAIYTENTTLRIVNQLTMAVADLMATKYYPGQKALSCKPDGQDVCQSLSSELKELTSCVDFIEENRKKETNNEEEDEEDEVQDPSYQPNSASEESMTESEDQTEGEAEGLKEGRKREIARMHVKYLKRIAVTRETLQTDYQDAACSYLCAKELGLEALALNSSLAMKYMTHVARKEFAIDLAINHDVNAVEEEKKKSTMAAIKQNLADAKVEKSQTQGTSSDEETSTGMKIERQSNTRKRKIIHRKEAQSSHKCIKLTPKCQSTSKAKFNLKIKPASDSEDSEDKEEALEKTDEETGPSEKRSHHVIVKCRIPGSGLKVKDIKRHLKIHVTKKQLEESDVPRAAAILKAGKNLRGPPLTTTKKEAGRPGRFRKWCPVPGCNTITTYLTQHLTKAHKLKSTHIAYKVHLKSAKRYTGIQELEMLLSMSPATHEKKKRPHQLEKTEILPDKAEVAESEAETDKEAAEPIAEDSNEEEWSEKLQEDEAETGQEYEEKSNDEEEPEKKKMKKEEYYSATKFLNARHQWLCGFFSFLHLPSAGYKKLQNRLQHVSQVQNILEVLDPNGDDITILGSDFGDIVWKQWVVHPHLENNTKAPGTLTSYLTSLEKFFVFVTSNRYHKKDMPPLHGDYLDIFRETISALKGWRATVDNETQHIQHRGFLKECDTILTPADIKGIEESKPYRAGMKALNEANAGKHLSLQEFTDARDLLLVKLALLVGSRPGPLENARLEDYYGAKEKDGNKIMLIPKHKRSKAGPAALGMDKELQMLMEVYVKKIRPRIAKAGVEHLFVKTDGEQFQNNTIGKRFAAFWEKSGVRKDKRNSQRSVRKFVITATKRHAPQEVGNIQKVLCHGEKSSRNCYLREDLTGSASRAINVIKDVTSKENATESEACK